jgi:type II secretory pathway pseudopilin PulG
MRKRRGFTLIEVLTVIICLTLLLGLSVALLRALMRAEESGRAAVIDATNLARLAHQFREDAHAASSVEIAPARLTFRLAEDRTSQYELRDDDLVVVHEGAADDRRQEAYRLKTFEQPAFSIDDANGSQIAVMRFPAQVHRGEPREHRALLIEAVVGRDARPVRPVR